MPTLHRRSQLSRTALALTLSALCSGAFAAGALDRASSRGKLVVAVDYVVPAYKGGAKFRTPETIDTALATELAKRVNLPLETVAAKPSKKAGALPQAGRADVLLTTLADPAAVPKTHTVIPVGYSAGPMAIMRSDTTIKSWAQLKDRVVCTAEGGHHVGDLAARYGAIEKVYRAPADALIAVRIGDCDATIHDHVMLEEVIKLPEWKKFSARLPTGTRTTLAFVVPAKDRTTVAALKRVADDWTASGLPEELMRKAVRHIAFEVYLDQDVPDCH